MEPEPITHVARRSRSGCWTCRSKTVKKRCDQQRPCGRCSRLNLHCDYSARPTLAERRKAVKSTNSPQTTDDITEGTESTTSSPASNYCSTSTSCSLSIASMSAPSSAACSLDLSTADHEAIRHFRTKFAKSHHIKNMDYSLISLMFNMAHKDLMVMHMVLAVALQEVNSRRPHPQASGQQSSLQHYSSAIRLMARTISPETKLQNLDAIYTTLWLMLLYEQQFGDSHCTAYIHHLEGVSSLLQHQFHRLPASAPVPSDSTENAIVRRTSPKSIEHPILSVYSARVLTCIALLDAAAASSGIGGQVNATILSTLGRSWSNYTAPLVDSPTILTTLHRYSNPLYHLACGDGYPPSTDDDKDRSVYSFLAGCVQLRFMTAQLITLHLNNPVRATEEAANVGECINRVGEEFKELISVANRLPLETDNSNSLIANIRVIVPTYYAVVLDFLRIPRFNLPLSTRQHHALKTIINLAFQNHRHGGDEATAKLAWPLFIVALETDDLLHREWILERFQACSKYGKSFERAYSFLRTTLPIQQRLGKRIHVREEMQKAALFVLG
ncbi:hypothetical protein BKA66DRAFT_608450 [Pyrenochaeta sp. MPI-SDFR-AT-0127]|nr:hypothetical protein BKA66DRAFT_608450 [Pyrenochaeta sp. MPI-SDFR-AT-0127]